MNVKFWKKHQKASLEEATKMLHKSHKDILELTETFTNEELFSKDTYKWVGGSTLGSYFVGDTSSYYDWAMKKLKTHQKNCKSKQRKLGQYGTFYKSKRKWNMSFGKKPTTKAKNA